MIINVIGKRHCSGTSKNSGKPFDFSEVFFIGQQRNVEGQAGLSFTVDLSLISYSEIVIGADYNVEFGPGGYLVSFKRK